MNKETFLSELLKALTEEEISEAVIKETLREYESMIDDATESGEPLESFIKRMGSPKKVAKALAKEKPRRANKLVALSPFIATILFFISGVVYQAWHPGWLFFLLIPITGILTKKPINWRSFAIFFILIVVVLIVTNFNLLNPFWSLFLLVIPFEKGSSNSTLKKIAQIYLFVSVGLYHLIILGLFFRFLGSGANSELVDLYMTLPLLLFVPIIFYWFFNGNIQIRFDLDWKNPNFRLRSLLKFIIAVGVTVLYLILGLLWGAWHPGWVIFLTIPLFYLVWGKEKPSFTAVMPFLATILFVLVGEYATIPGQETAYALSWLFFLLIPITGILEKR